QLGLLCSVCILANHGALGQSEVVEDTLAVSRDTLIVVPSPSGVDSIVSYSAADSIVYSLSTRTMHLYGDAELQYRALGVKAAVVDIDWNTARLHARGVPDTADTTGKLYQGLPVLSDGPETYKGFTVSYNFVTKKGKIDLGKTEMENNYYSGEAIKKVEDNVLYVQGGRFTSCDLDDSHYYFGSPTMKVFMGDEVVARPVYFYIDDVPVFALPFGVFPTARGRRSGLLTPIFGESFRGRYLRNLGYYWAINDYMDWSVRGDVYSKGGYTFYTDFRYALRYIFTGGLSASFGRTVTGEAGDADFSDNQVFNVRVLHNQTINPTTRLDVDLTFISSTYYQETSTNLNELLLQNIVSNATLTKSWEGTPNSLTLNIRRDQNLQPRPGQVETTDLLPSVIFTRSQNYPFRSEGTLGTSSLRWYEYLGYAYTGQFLNRRTETKLEQGSLLDNRLGAQHLLRFNASPKVGYITVAPFFNYTSRWYNKSVEKQFNPIDSSVVTREVKEFTAVRFFDLGVSATTKLYGVFHPGVFGITGFRHQLIPSVSYVYQPDFSAPGWGYYGRYTDASGREQIYDRFEGALFGGAPAGERQLITLSLGNVFEMKTAAADTSVEENKFQLLNLNLGGAYNFAADSLKFSEIGVNFRTAIGEFLNIGGNARFNLYKFETDPANLMIGRRVNKFLIAEEGRLVDMTSFNISIGTRLTGEKISSSAGPVRSERDTAGVIEKKSSYVSLYDEVEPDFSIPWSLDLTWNFAQSQADPRRVIRSSTLAIRLGFNLTEFWKITASANYDLIQKQIAAPLVTVYRDLHCWEMNFSWVPVGRYRNYKFEIRLKTPMLQDLKVTKQFSETGVY
ncbi:MAG: LPS-assembly protein LptD, partial [Bacteroidetes bacterium]|nr:LPS-assembly protein LptD [Bacteroidota bacterium]